MDTYDQEKNLGRRIQTEIGPAICEALGGTWTVTEREQEWGSTLHNEEGHKLFIRTAGTGVSERGKIKVYAMLPDDSRDHIRYDERDRRDTINVSATKTPVQIAKEIERRLLPDYVEYFAVIKERMDVSTNARNQRDTIGAELAAMWPGSTYYGAPDKDQRGTSRAHMEGKVTYPVRFEGYGEIELYHDGSKAKIEISSVPIDTVRRVMAALAEAN